MSSFHGGERRHRDVWICISVSLLLDSKKVCIWYLSLVGQEINRQQERRAGGWKDGWGLYWFTCWSVTGSEGGRRKCNVVRIHVRAETPVAALEGCKCMAFDAAIGRHEADSSFNLFNHRKLLYSLANILWPTMIRLQLQGSFSWFVCFFIYCHTSPVWSGSRLARCGLSLVFIRRWTDRQKRRLGDARGDLASSRSSFVRFIPTEMIVCIISLLTTFNIRLH